MSEVKDPHNRQEVIRSFDGVEANIIEDVAAVFVGILLRGSRHRLLASLSDDIFFGWHDYQTQPDDKQRLQEFVNQLVVDLEPFFKMVLYLTQGEEPGEKDPGMKKLLSSALSGVWREGNRVDDLIWFVREWRHRESHNAPKATVVDLYLYMEAAIGVYLLVVDENFDALADLVLSKPRIMLRNRSSQRDFLSYMANPRGLTNSYIPSMGRLDGDEEGVAGLSDLLDEFLLSNQAKVLLLVGRAGSGKTTFLQRELSRIAAARMDTSNQDWHQYPMPVYYPLRRLRCVDGVCLDQTILHRVNDLGRFGWTQVTPEELFGTQDSSWIIALDGLDELQDWESGIQIVQDFVARYAAPQREIRIILASRPDFLDDSWHDRYSMLEIVDWSEEEIQAYVTSRRPELADSFFEWLYETKLLDLVRIPLLLECVFDFWLQFEDEIMEIELERDRIRALSRESEPSQIAEIAELTRELRNKLLEVVSPVQATDYAIRGFMKPYVLV